MNASDIFTVCFGIGGLFFFTAGAVGLLRFPDTSCRLHALTKADNLGLGLIAIGLVPQAMSFFDSVQLVLTWLFVLISSAVCGYLVLNYELGAGGERDQTENTRKKRSAP